MDRRNRNERAKLVWGQMLEVYVKDRLDARWSISAAKTPAELPLHIK